MVCQFCTVHSERGHPGINSCRFSVSGLLPCSGRDYRLKLGVAYGMHLKLGLKASKWASCHLQQAQQKPENPGLLLLGVII